MKERFKKTTLQIFLCHAHADREAARALWSRLRKDGVDAWLDREKLLAGQDWEHEIRKAILKSDALIVCLSNAFNKQKGFRHEELKIALKIANLLSNEETFVIPVRLETCELPHSLRRLHCVDLFEAGGYKKLIRALRKRNVAI